MSDTEQKFLGRASIARLEEIAESELAHGHLWQPRIVAELDNLGRWFWRDIEDDCPTYHGPFTSKRKALIDAINKTGMAD
jgi:hypothetical protein